MSKLNGKWKFTLSTMMGEQTSIDTFQVDGNVLTGTVFDVMAEETAPIEEGTVDGNKFNFKVRMPMPFGLMPFEITGELLPDDTLVGQSEMPMGTSTFTAARMD